MRAFWLARRGQPQLVVFCCGWGMDQWPFASLAAEDMDVLLLYDFQEPDDIGELIGCLEHYRQRVLLGWSMGVWGGQRLFGQHSHLFSRTLAINGTLCPIDDRFGIGRELFSGTLHGWSQRSRDKFYRRMCGTPEILARFLLVQPQRSITDQQQELAYYLDNASCVDRRESIYGEVMISSDDRIVPTVNQLAYWGLAEATFDGSHFPFYHWRTWNQLLDELPVENLTGSHP